MNKYKDETTLRRLYVEEDMSQIEVADELGCSTGTISKYLDLHGIDTGYMSYSEKDALDITSRQMQIMTGVLMGDGCVKERDTPRPRFVTQMTSKPFINWLSSELSPLTTDVRLFRTAAQSSNIGGGSEGDYSDSYIVETRGLTQLNGFSSFYTDSGKRWPASTDITPLVLKMLYVCDGTVHQHGTDRPAMKIYASEQTGQKKIVSDMFERSGIDITWYDDSFYIDADQTETLFEEMGPSPPGFGYKWGI